MECPACNQSNTDGAAVCRNCGHLLVPERETLPITRAQDRLSNSPFVGRDSQLAVLRTGLDDTLSGHRRILFLAGEPGIGKTRLASELATEAQERGAQVLVGRCYEGEGAPPFWPWVQIVRTHLSRCDVQTLKTEMGAGGADIAQVIPEVRERLPDLPTPPGVESEQARFRFFDSLTRFLKIVRRGNLSFSSSRTCTGRTSLRCCFCNFSHASCKTLTCWFLERIGIYSSIVTIRWPRPSARSSASPAAKTSLCQV